MKRNRGWIRHGNPAIKHLWWVHSETGCIVRHCGHPTALRPYYGQFPDEREPKWPGENYVPKFAHLAEAQDWLLQQWRIDRMAKAVAQRHSETRTQEATR